MAKHENICKHIKAINELKLPESLVCVECQKHGGQWVHLRTCQTCGITLCCDSSPGQHMSKHALAEGHPVAISAEPGERWLWCYVDELLVEY